jgi:hypothetical protein
MKMGFGGLLAAMTLAAVAMTGENTDISVKTMPPSVVKTIPQAGETAVDPALKEIRVTFSKDMLTERSWSVCQISDETFPKMGEIHWDPKDKRTIVVPVELQPGKTYVLWFNSPKFHGFVDADRNSAVPYLLVFQTTGAGRPDF